MINAIDITTRIVLFWRIAQRCIEVLGFVRHAMGNLPMHGFLHITWDCRLMEYFWTGELPDGASEPDILQNLDYVCRSGGH